MPGRRDWGKWKLTRAMISLWKGSQYRGSKKEHNLNRGLRSRGSGHQNRTRRKGMKTPGANRTTTHSVGDGAQRKWGQFTWPRANMVQAAITRQKLDKNKRWRGLQGWRAPSHCLSIQRQTRVRENITATTIRMKKIKAFPFYVYRPTMGGGLGTIKDGETRF